METVRCAALRCVRDRKHGREKKEIRGTARDERDGEPTRKIPPLVAAGRLPPLQPLHVLYVLQDTDTEDERGGPGGGRAPTPTLPAEEALHLHLHAAPR